MGNKEPRRHVKNRFDHFHSCSCCFSTQHNNENSENIKKFSCSFYTYNTVDIAFYHQIFAVSISIIYSLVIKKMFSSLFGACNVYFSMKQILLKVIKLVYTFVFSTIKRFKL